MVPNLPTSQATRRNAKPVMKSMQKQYQLGIELSGHVEAFLDSCEACPPDGLVILHEIERVIMSRAFLLRAFHDFQEMVERDEKSS